MRVLTADQQRVKEMVDIFNTPIVFHPGGWEDTLPEWLRLRVIRERVEMVCNGGWTKATDAEVTCYLYTASLSQPLDSDWTEITLYEAAKQMPQLYQVVPATPKELSDYQKKELEDLKRKIRDSQLKRQNKSKKEEQEPMRKIVIDEKEGKVLMGVMKENADPVIKTVEGTLENALGGIPQLLADAEAEWAKSLKRPAYKAPPEPKTKGKEAATKPAETKTAEDLPLLAETTAEKPVETVETKAEEKAEPVVAAVAPVASEMKPTEPAPAAPAVPLPAPTPVSQVEPTAPTGQWEYYLEDGRGPFANVQAAMDELGMDKATRPQHNRWDRLSTELKKKIQRREKKA
jgi:hypothetical protein